MYTGTIVLVRAQSIA